MRRAHGQSLVGEFTRGRSRGAIEGGTAGVTDGHGAGIRGCVRGRHWGVRLEDERGRPASGHAQEVEKGVKEEGELVRVCMFARGMRGTLMFTSASLAGRCRPPAAAAAAVPCSSPC